MTLAVLFICPVMFVSAQTAARVPAPTPDSAGGIVTAENFLATVSTTYAGIKDYEAAITIKAGSSSMAGDLSYLQPYYLRIDFSNPKDQVLLYDGSVLTIYLPGYHAVLNQSAPSAGAGLATPAGLSLLRRNYTVSYLSSPNPIPLDATGESPEMVIKLRLIPRSNSEGFRELILSIDPADNLIHRIEGTTIAGTTITFNFSNIKLNQGIPAMRFVYDSPATANMYDNFLFSDSGD
jgi:outer membrane lipoprotein-sorting protein